ncbi:MAG: hypothetical protein P8M71_01440 [Pseudomonadales bacterium]|nr:hypothetical protein [Pseudomonadales bacterium]
MNSKIIRLAAISFLFFCEYSYSSDEGQSLSPPLLDDAIHIFCVKNPYDCNSGGVTHYKLNIFLYDYYLKIERFFTAQGFSGAEFEYCISGDCYEEGVDVLNSEYKITKTFPPRKDYFRAFGGVNKNLGVHFTKVLDLETAVQECSLTVRNPDSISMSAQKKIEKGKVKDFRDLKSKFYKKYLIKLSQYYPSIDTFSEDFKLPSAECWLEFKSKRIVFEPVGG